jgi:hypothetical protein
MPSRKSVARPRPTERRRATGSPAPAARLVPRHIDLREVPHAHAVCRQCGRITEVSLGSFDAAQLTSLASSTPEEWSVDGISLSMTGLCPKCRQGLSAP